MPQVVGAVAVFFINAFAIETAVGIAYAFMAAELFVYGAGAYLLNRAADALKPNVRPQARGISLEANFLGTAEPKRIVYGEQRIGGMHFIPPICTGNKGQYLHFGIVLAGHECESITDVWFDGTKIEDAWIGAVADSADSGLVSSGLYKNVAWIRRYLGTSTQTADYLLKQAYPDAFDDEYRGRGNAYIALQCKYDDKIYSGPPTVAGLVRGKKIYDPRSTSTAWSSNPALCVRDFLINEVGFDAESIDDDSVIAAANICDQLVDIPNTATQKRYQCNAMLIANSNWGDNLRVLVDTMRGRALYRDGKWRIFAGAWDTPLHQIDESDWISALDVRLSLPRAERWNAVRVFYVDPARNYQRVECFPRRNTAYETQDNALIYYELELPGVNNEYEAQRHGEFANRASRNQITVTGTLKPQWIRLCPGDTIQLTDSEYGWNNKTFRVMAMNITPKMEIEVAMTEEGSELWDDLDPLAGEYDEIITWPTLDPGATYPDELQNFAAVGRNGSIDFTWQPGSSTMLGERVQLIEYTNSYEPNLGTTLWQGVATGVNIQKTDTTTRFYWLRAIVGSYTSGYTPESYGYPMGALGGGADGIDGVAATLSLPSVTLGADVNGIVSDYGPAAGQFDIVAGGTNRNSSTVFDVASLAGVAGTINSADNSPVSGKPIGYYEVTGCTSDQGVAWYTGVYSGVTYLRGFSVSKARTGSSGLDAIHAYLSMPSITLASSSNGYVPDYGNAEGMFNVSQGDTDKTANATFSINSLAGLTGTVNTADNSPVAGKVKGYYRVTDASSQTAAMHMRASYGGFNFDMPFVVTKGVAGIPARTLALLPSAQAFLYDYQGNSIGVNTINFDASLQNLAGTIGIYAQNYRSDGTALSSYQLSGSGNSNRGLHVNSFTENGSTAYAAVVASLSGGYSDRITVVRLQQGPEGTGGTPGSPGIAGLVGVLTNENHSLPSSSNGYIASYAGAVGEFQLFLGIDRVNVNSITFSTEVKSPSGLSAAISAAGSYYINGGIGTSDEFGAAVFRAVFSGSNVDKVFTVAKALSGFDGQDGDPGAPGTPGGIGPPGSNILANGTMTFVDSVAGTLANWGGNTVANTYDDTGGIDGTRALYLGSYNAQQVYMNDTLIPVSPLEEFLDVSVFARSVNSGQRLSFVMECYDSHLRPIHSWGESLRGFLKVYSPTPVGTTTIYAHKPYAGDGLWQTWASSFNSMVFPQSGFPLDNTRGWPDSADLLTSTPHYMASVNTTLSNSYDRISLAVTLPVSVAKGEYIGVGVQVASYRTFPNSGYTTVGSAFKQYTIRFGGLNLPLDRHTYTGQKCEPKTFRQRTAYVKFGVVRETGGTIADTLIDEYIVQRRPYTSDGSFVQDPYFIQGGGAWEFPFGVQITTYSDARYCPDSGPAGGGVIVFNTTTAVDAVYGIGI
jgi:hypothetical protein